MVERDAGLAMARNKLNAAKDNLANTRKDAINRCKHDIVFEARLLYDGPNPIGRICPRCSYEEHAWGWPSCSATNNDRDEHFNSILNTEIVVKCDTRKFYSFRA